MAYSYGSGSRELSSRNLIQLGRVNHAYKSGNTSESQSKDQLRPLIHFTNKFLVSPKPEANLASSLNGHGQNKSWKPFTLRRPTIMASLLSMVALISLIEYINKICDEENALFFAESADDFPMSVVFCYRYLPQMVVVALGMG